MRSSSPKPLDRAIGSVLQELGLGKRIKQYEVIETWPTIVGRQIATVAIAERMEKGVLFVHVTRAPWRNELVFLKKELIEKINKAMNQNIVKDIIFR
jgi:predicted nucleic acid-binding Zn ribbon protein